ASAKLRPASCSWLKPGKSISAWKASNSSRDQRSAKASYGSHLTSTWPRSNTTVVMGPVSGTEDCIADRLPVGVASTLDDGTIRRGAAPGARMEAMSTDRSAPAVPAAATWRAKVPGLALAVVATAIGTAVPVIGSPVSGVVLGVLVGVLVRRRTDASSVAALSPGLKLASKLVLQVAVVLLGARLSLAQVAQVGVDSLP